MFIWPNVQKRARKAPKTVRCALTSTHGPLCNADTGLKSPELRAMAWFVISLWIIAEQLDDCVRDDSPHFSKLIVRTASACLEFGRKEAE